MNNVKKKLHEPNNTDGIRRPEWPELIVCFIAYVTIIFAGIWIINSVVPPDTVFYGLSLSALSALGGIGAFGVTYFSRLRNKASFGVCCTSAKWLLIGVGFGVGVFILVRIFSVFYLMLGGIFTNLQKPYQVAATGGTISLIMQLLLIAVATPIGEELAFRGVLTNALLRFRPWVSIFVSSLVFALGHGLNEIFIAAFITGLATSYLFYKTKSIWPGVAVHATNNALGTILSVLLFSIT